MFLGQYKHSVDGKGRVVMPSRFRDALVGRVVITPGRESQLVVYPEAVYEKEALKVKEKTERRSGRRIARATFGKADIQTLDSAGRLLLSLALREHAGLDQGDSVTVLGMGDNIEIWQHDRWLVEEPLAMAALKRDEEEDGIES